MNIKALGTKLAKLRESAGLSQDALALKAQVARNLISSLEKGRGNPTLGTLEALAAALGSSLLDLLGAEPKPIPFPAPAPKNLKARALAVAHPQELIAGIDFLSRFVRQSPDLQLLAMAIVFEDSAYLKKVSPQYREHLARLVQQLLKAQS